jgi:hypothetical protein
MQYSINKEINSLSFLKTLGNKFDSFLIGEFEVEPFTKWSTEFAAEYWFIKYSLLENKVVELDFSANELENLCAEKNLNVIWLTLTDKKNFKLKCVDGSWELEILNSTFDGLEVVTSLGE